MGACALAKMTSVRWLSPSFWGSCQSNQWCARRSRQAFHSTHSPLCVGPDIASCDLCPGQSDRHLWLRWISRGENARNYSNRLGVVWRELKAQSHLYCKLRVVDFSYINFCLQEQNFIFTYHHYTVSFLSRDINSCDWQGSLTHFLCKIVCTFERKL
jgi:hypothetical protein